MAKSTNSLVKAVESGDKRAALIALRDELARRIATAEDRNVAALAARLTEIVQILEQMEPGEEGTPLDEFTQRRIGQSGPKSRTGS